jgi:hypothetical protein
MPPEILYSFKAASSSFHQTETTEEKNSKYFSLFRKLAQWHNQIDRITRQVILGLHFISLQLIET